MHAKCHYELGKMLAGRYIPGAPRRYRWAFLAGCTQPDKNPATYLKGSLRFRLLQGHHFSSARRYMARLCRRLEQRKRLKLSDFYTLGKLLHYTADAFTYPHNDHFPGGLSAHRRYEEELKRYMLRHLNAGAIPFPPLSDGMMASISAYHRRYRAKAGSPERDTRFILGVCAAIMGMAVL